MLHPGTSKRLKVAIAVLVVFVVILLIFSHQHRKNGLVGNTDANRPAPAQSPTAQSAIAVPKRKREVSVTSALPEPPPKGLRFYGYAKKPDQAEQVFISEGDNVFIGRAGDIVGRHYKIIRITRNSVELENLLNSRRLTLALPKEVS